MLSPEIENRDEIEVRHELNYLFLSTGRSTKRPSTLNDIYTILSSSGSQKKIGHELNDCPSVKIRTLKLF
jgi:hypothetical protein